MSNGKMWQTDGVTETREKPEGKDKFPKKGPRKSPRERRMSQEDYEDLDSLGLTASQYRAVLGDE